MNHLGTGVYGNVTLLEVIKKIDSFYDSIALTIHGLSDDYLSGQKIAEAFSYFKPQVRYLGLGFNQLGKMNPDELIQGIKGVPDFITQLGLQDNHLGELPAEKLAEVFKAVKPSVDHLDISGNEFHLLVPYYERHPRGDDKPYKIALSGINKNVTSIRLLISDYTYLRSALPSHLERLQLFVLLHLYSFSGQELASTFETVPPNIHELDLSGIQFSYVRHSLPSTFASLPSHINKLNLSGDDTLCNIPFETLLETLSAIPEHVLEINLSESSLLDGKTDEQIKALHQSLCCTNKNRVLIGIEFNKPQYQGTLFAAPRFNNTKNDPMPIDSPSC